VKYAKSKTSLVPSITKHLLMNPYKSTNKNRELSKSLGKGNDEEGSAFSTQKYLQNDTDLSYCGKFLNSFDIFTVLLPSVMSSKDVMTICHKAFSEV